MTKILTASFYGKENMIGGSERFFDNFRLIYPETQHVYFEKAAKVLYNAPKEALKEFRFFEVEAGVVLDNYLYDYETLFKPDLIIRNSWSGGFIKLNTPEIAVFQDVHHTAANILAENGFYNPVAYNRIAIIWTELQKKIASMSVLNVAVSEFVKEKMKEIGIDCQKVIYHGIDLNHFKPLNKEELRKKYKIPLDKKVGIWVGRFHPQKGWHIMSRLIKKFKDIFWICIFMHDVPHRPRFKNCLAVQNAPYEVMPELYNLADFFILPTCCESFGLSSLEACACGIPIITQRTGIWYDLYNEETGDDGDKDLFLAWNVGYLINKWNYESYEKAVLKMLKEEILEPKLKPREIAEEFSIEKWKKEWKELIDLYISKEK